MRNYIAELRALGYSAGKIAEETGISRSTIGRIERGQIRLRSGSDRYDALRNATRRAGYRAAVDAGISPEGARARRRTISNPDLPVVEIQTLKRVKFRQPQTRWQLRILAEFWNPDLDERRIMEGYSRAYRKYNEGQQMKEAIDNARGRLHGTNWLLVRLIEHEVMEYQLS